MALNMTTFMMRIKKLVDFYRGCVIIWGDEQTLKGIKDAWNNKDWNAFRNYGIMFGKETSASKYKLQEALLKNISIILSHLGKIN